MTRDRQEMLRALKAIAVPRIRALGFAGAFPHFRRKSAAGYDFLMIIFNRHGGSFYLETGHMSEAELAKTEEACKLNPLRGSKVTVAHCGVRTRERLGGNTRGSDSDHWFEFGPDNQSGPTFGYHPPSYYEGIATDVARTIDTQVEAFFARFKETA